jgi:hypothetical protein
MRWCELGWVGDAGIGAGSDMLRLGLLTEDSFFISRLYFAIVLGIFGCWELLGSDSSQLGILGPNWGVGSHAFGIQAARWVTLATPSLPFQVSCCHSGCLGHLKVDAAGERADIAKNKGNCWFPLSF